MRIVYQTLLVNKLQKKTVSIASILLLMVKGIFSSKMIWYSLIQTWTFLSRYKAKPHYLYGFSCFCGSYSYKNCSFHLHQQNKSS